MNHSTSRAWTALGLAAFALTCISTSALADEPLRLPRLLITAGIEPKPEKEIAGSYTIITSEEIEAHQYKSLTDALRMVPGISLVPTGGAGSQTSMFMRGSNSNQTLVLLNGHAINDPSSAAGAFNFGNFMLADVERIEVLRGPQSALYGSQAIGGVVNIITKSGNGAPVNTVVAEGGTLGTLNLNLGTAGSLGNAQYAFSLWRNATKGNDVTPKRLRGGAAREKEGTENIGGSLNLSAPIGEYLTASTFIRYSYGSVELDEGGFDAFFNPVYQDPLNKYRSKEFYASGSLKGKFLDGRWRPALSFGVSRYAIRITDEPDFLLPTYAEDISNRGRRFNLGFDNAFDIADSNTLTFGASYTHENLRATGFQDFGGGFVLNPASQASTQAASYYASDTQRIMDRFFLTVSGRYDAPQDSDNRFTYTIAPSYYHPETDTKVFASYGTAFKTPSLYQRFGFLPDSFGSVYTGNPNLDAEKSKGWEAGFEQGLMDGALKLGGSYFRNKIQNGIVIVYDPFFNSSTANLNTPFRTHGFESFVEAKPFTGLTARLDYTFTVVNAQIVSSTLTRRPRHQLGFSTIWQLDEETNFSTNVKWIDPYLDIRRDTPVITYIKPKSYVVVDIAASRSIWEGVALTARVNNLFDKRYEPAHGFEAQGIEALAGIRLSF